MTSGAVLLRQLLVTLLLSGLHFHHLQVSLGLHKPQALDLFGEMFRVLNSDPVGIYRFGVITVCKVCGLYCRNFACRWCGLFVL